MRIVTTACSNTEIVCALGAATDLVGVDDHSDYPADVVAGLPRVGPDLSVDPEKVAALKPDIVLASLTVPGHEKVVASLRAAGLPVHASGPQSLADVCAGIRRIGELIGRPAPAARLADKMEGAFEPTARTPSERPSILVEWWPKPVIAPGRLSWVHDLIDLAGGRNPLGEEEVESRPLTNGELAAHDPDAVVISWCGVPAAKYRREVVLQRADCQNISAVRNGRVYAIPEAYLGRPGPRLLQGLEQLKDVVMKCRDGQNE